jgi:hypothetical protein
MDTPWLKPYAPVHILRAADVFADHVDFWEEEAFRVRGQWRKRELTDFIRAGLVADKSQCHRFKQLLVEYIELSLHHPPPKSQMARRKALEVAMVDVRKWLRTSEQ